MQNNSPKFGTDEYRDYFRTTYINKDAGLKFLNFKNGKLYLVVVFSIAILASVLSSLLISNWNISYLILFPFYFLFANLIEYVIHRFPMHKPMKGFDFLFEHVTVHHSFYNENYAYHKDPRDYFAVFLPLQYLTFITLIIFATAYVIYLVGGRDHGLFFIFFAYLYYLAYEILHFSYHANEDSLIKKIPFIKSWGQMHLDHHETKLMTTHNFNISFPVYDYIFGTVFRKKN